MSGSALATDNELKIAVRTLTVSFFNKNSSPDFDSKIKSFIGGPQVFSCNFSTGSAENRILKN